MANKLISYLILFVLGIQTVSADVDLHLLIDNKSPVDISHHFIDEHQEISFCDNDTISDKVVHDETDSHHGCTGHVSFMYQDSLSCFNTAVIHSDVSILKSSGNISVYQSSLFRPPIFS